MCSQQTHWVHVRQQFQTVNWPASGVRPTQALWLQSTMTPMQCRTTPLGSKQCVWKSILAFAVPNGRHCPAVAPMQELQLFWQPASMHICAESNKTSLTTCCYDSCNDLRPQYMVYVRLLGGAENATIGVNAETLIGSGAQLRSCYKLLPAKTDARSPKSTGRKFRQNNLKLFRLHTSEQYLYDQAWH